MGDNIKMKVKEIMLEGVNWIHLAQDRGHWLALMNIDNKRLGCIKGG
jgi:hypothetical protein